MGEPDMKIGGVSIILVLGFINMILILFQLSTGLRWIKVPFQVHRRSGMVLFISAVLHGRLFRALHDDDQAMFRDYGALKHTTLAAQCAVCHRLHEVPDANLGGFITLGPSAKPRPAVTGLERLRLAEREVQQSLVKLRKVVGD